MLSDNEKLRMQKAHEKAYHWFYEALDAVGCNNHTRKMTDDQKAILVAAMTSAAATAYAATDDKDN